MEEESMNTRRVGTIRVGAGDIQLGQLNVTHPMSPSVEDGARPWSFWDSTLSSNLEGVTVQVLDMHPTQRWRKPEDASELAQLVADLGDALAEVDAHRPLATCRSVGRPEGDLGDTPAAARHHVKGSGRARQHDRDHGFTGEPNLLAGG